MPYYVFRVDDVGWTHHETSQPPIKRRDRGLEIAQRFHEAMGGVPYLAAIIPDALDPNGMLWLSKKPAGMTVAQHGFDHGRMRPDQRDEFAGMSLDRMRERVDRGRRRLMSACGEDVSHFVPPYNAWDDTLAQACAHEGIKVMWTGFEIWPLRRFGVLLIPATPAFYGASGWKQGAAESDLVSVAAAHAHSQALIVVTLHITWESAKDPEFKHVARLAQALREHAITPDEAVGLLTEKGF